MGEKPVPTHKALHKLLEPSRILLPSCGSMVPSHLWVSLCWKHLCPCPMFSKSRAKNPYTNKMKGKDFNWPSLTQGFPPAPCKPSGKCCWVCKEYFSEKSMAFFNTNITIFSAHPLLISVFKLYAQGSSSSEITESQRGLWNICHIRFKTFWAAKLHNLTSSIKKSLRFSSLLQEQWEIVLFGSPCWEIKRCFSDMLFGHVLKHFETPKKKQKKQMCSLLWEIISKVKGTFQQWTHLVDLWRRHVVPLRHSDRLSYSITHSNSLFWGENVNQIS